MLLTVSLRAAPTSEILEDEIKSKDNPEIKPTELTNSSSNGFVDDADDDDDLPISINISNEDDSSYEIVTEPQIKYPVEIQQKINDLTAIATEHLQKLKLNITQHLDR